MPCRKRLGNNSQHPKTHTNNQNRPEHPESGSTKKGTVKNDILSLQGASVSRPDTMSCIRGFDFPYQLITRKMTTTRFLSRTLKEPSLGPKQRLKRANISWASANVSSSSPYPRLQQKNRRGGAFGRLGILTKNLGIFKEGPQK